MTADSRRVRRVSVAIVDDVLKVELVMRDFEGSVTVPPELVR